MRFSLAVGEKVTLSSPLMPSFNLSRLDGSELRDVERGFGSNRSLLQAIHPFGSGLLLALDWAGGGSKKLLDGPKLFFPSFFSFRRGGGGGVADGPWVIKVYCCPLGNGML
jgi:hypothetical protein